GRTAGRAYEGMSSARGSMSLKGKNMAVYGDSTIVYPMVRWLYDYAGLIPVSIGVSEGPDPVAMERLREFLASVDCIQALDSPIPPRIYLVAGDGDTVRRMEIGKVCSVGLDIGYPSLYDGNFMKKNVIGHNGVLYLLERIVNGRPMMTM
ncbi:MAG: hypothetical protein MJZ68_06825, partial [archaeon]|nr:hypothetical protein [archaeon]